MDEQAIIVLNGVQVAHKENIILNDVELEMKKGEFVYLIGRTGSGKSSFLETLYGELPLKVGQGTVAGFDLRKLKRKQVPDLRRRLGIVFQHFQLLSDRSVLANLEFVLRATGWKKQPAIEERMRFVLDAVGLESKGYKFPNELSGGELQRIAIARALLNDPELILADEPTGNLDPETTIEIMTLLQEISKNGRAILMATHDYNIMKMYPMRTIKCENQQLLDSSNLALI